MDGGLTHPSTTSPIQITSTQEINLEGSVSDLKEKATIVTPEASPPSTGSEHETPHECSASNLKGKTVLITGGASGLGAAIAKEFAKNGAYVTIADINEDLGKAYEAELKSQGLNINFTPTDVTSWPSHTTAFKSAIAYNPTTSKIDIVIASAGLWGTPFLHPTDAPASLSKDPPHRPHNRQPHRADLHRQASPILLQPPLPNPTGLEIPDPHRLERGYLEIPLAATYNASKWGVRGFFRTIRAPLAARGVRVDLIAPWLMDTPMSRPHSAAFQAVGMPVGEPAVVVKAVMRCAVDEEIVGRAFVVGPGVTMDLGDDEEGGRGWRG
ncbi:hypothetical protein MMC30_008824 [Trapelia coarctata]|nr:hypothetical protein [Trapelia coarctata]